MKSQDGGFLGAMMTPMAASLIVPIASSWILSVASSLITDNFWDWIYSWRSIKQNKR